MVTRTKGLSFPQIAEQWPMVSHTEECVYFFTPSSARSILWRINIRYYERGHLLLFLVDVLSLVRLWVVGLAAAMADSICAIQYCLSCEEPLPS